MSKDESKNPALTNEEINNSTKEDLRYIEITGRRGFAYKELTHPERLERNLIFILAIVILASFVVLREAYVKSEGEDRTVIEFAQASGTTSLGALVAVLARRKKDD